MMNAIIRYWHNFARYVKHGHAQPLPLVLQPIPVESWADRKRAYERTKLTHRDRRQKHEQFRSATRESLKRDAISRLDREDAAIHVLIESHPWFYARDPEAFEAAIKAIARRRVQEARR